MDGWLVGWTDGDIRWINVLYMKSESESLDVVLLVFFFFAYLFRVYELCLLSRLLWLVFPPGLSWILAFWFSMSFWFQNRVFFCMSFSIFVTFAYNVNVGFSGLLSIIWASEWAPTNGCCLRLLQYFVSKFIKIFFSVEFWITYVRWLVFRNAEQNFRKKTNTRREK